MNTAAHKFVSEIRAERGAQCADLIEDGLAAVFEEGCCGNGDALEFYDALAWIAAQPRTVDERLEAMQKISSLRGKVRINLKQFLGW